MKRSVRILRRALRDIVEIRRYVERDRPEASRTLTRRLLERIEALAAFPESGHVPRDERLAARGYRFLVEGEHLVFYKILSRQVRVYRVLHGRRRYQEVL